MTRPNQGRRNAVRIVDITNTCQGYMSQAREARNQASEFAMAAQQAVGAAEQAAETAKQHGGLSKTSTPLDPTQVQTRILWLEQENRDLRQQLASKDAVFTLFVEKLGYDAKKLAQEAATLKV